MSKHPPYQGPYMSKDVSLQEPPKYMYPGPHATTAAGGHNSIVLQAEPPKDHIIWSLCCFLYSNPLCLGLAALIFSIKSRDRKVVGDLEGARHYGATARCLNIIKHRNVISNLFYSHNLKLILFFHFSRTTNPSM
uniref:Uncharacterized protein n=1 Tax=Oryzias latipes TaxID=8090 RepID=A0A3P9LJ25_ORYLA